MGRLTVNRLFLCLLLAATCIFSEDLISPEQTEQLDAFVEEVLRCSHLPGLTVSAVKNGSVFARGYGKSDIEKDINVTADTLFRIGSITKTMTSTLLGKLLPEKFPKSLWDTKLKDILGDSFTLSTAELTEGVTVRDILSHRTGLGTGLLGQVVGYPENVTRAHLAKKLRFLPAVEPLRYKFIYNNLMYFLAGYLTEVLAGGTESWEGLLQRHFLKPLGMNSTGAAADPETLARENRLALPYVYNDGEFVKLPAGLGLYGIWPLEPAGAVFTSARDMTKWMQYLVDPLGDVRANPALGQTMMRVQALNFPPRRPVITQPTFPVALYPDAYGLGFFTGNYRGRILVSHGGLIIPYSSVMWLFPDEKIGVFLSTNGFVRTQNEPLNMIASYVTDLLMGETPWLNASTACTFPAPWEPVGTEPADSSNNYTEREYPPLRPSSEYVGTYGHPLFGDANVFINNEAGGRLEMKIGTEFHVILYPTEQKHIFRWEISEEIGSEKLYFLLFPGPRRVLFEESQDGRIDRLVPIIPGEENIFKKGVSFWDKHPSGAMPVKSTLTFLISTLILWFSMV